AASRASVVAPARSSIAHSCQVSRPLLRGGRSKSRLPVSAIRRAWPRANVQASSEAGRSRRRRSRPRKLVTARPSISRAASPPASRRGTGRADPAGPGAGAGRAGAGPGRIRVWGTARAPRSKSARPDGRARGQKRTRPISRLLRPGAGGRHVHLDLDLVADDPDRVAADLDARVVRPGAVGDAEPPGVPGAGDDAVLDVPAAERGPHVPAS